MCTTVLLTINVVYASTLFPQWTQSKERKEGEKKEFYSSINIIMDSPLTIIIIITE